MTMETFNEAVMSIGEYVDIMDASLKSQDIDRLALYLGLCNLKLNMMIRIRPGLKGDDKIAAGEKILNIQHAVRNLIISIVSVLQEGEKNIYSDHSDDETYPWEQKNKRTKDD